MGENLEDKAGSQEWKMTPVDNPSNNYNPGFLGRLKDKLSDYKYPLWGLALTGVLSVVGALGVRYGPETKRKIDNVNLVYENKLYVYVDNNPIGSNPNHEAFNLKLNMKESKVKPGNYFTVTLHYPNEENIEIVGIEESINGSEWKLSGALGTALVPSKKDTINGTKIYQMDNEEMKIRYRTLIKNSQGNTIPYETTEVLLTPTPHPQTPSHLEQKTQTE